MGRAFSDADGLASVKDVESLGVRLRVDRDGLDSEIMARTDDPDSYFTAVSDENLTHRAYTFIFPE